MIKHHIVILFNLNIMGMPDDVSQMNLKKFLNNLG